jgi:hypothetical protein
MLHLLLDLVRHMNMIAPSVAMELDITNLVKLHPARLELGQNSLRSLNSLVIGARVYENLQFASG